MKRLASYIFVLLLCCQFARAQSVPTAVKTAVEMRNYSAAIAELEKLRAENEKEFVAKDLDYLLARLLDSSGETSASMILYQEVSNRNSPVRPYALKHLAEIARSTGNLALEQAYLIEITEFAPESTVAESAEARLARNSFERANFSESIQILTTPEKQRLKPDAVASRENRMLLAESHLLGGHVEAARQIFTDLLDQTPNAGQPDDIALGSARRLDSIYGGEPGKKAPQLTEAEHFRRANVYQFNREFDEARLHYEAMIANYPDGANAGDAAFQIGRGLAQQTNYVEALKWYERVIERYPQSVAAKDALLQAASAYSRVVRNKEAISRYQQFIDKYPTDERLDRAYLNIVDILRDQGEDTDAIKQCEKIRTVFKGKQPEAVALYSEVRIYFAREEWQNAIDTIDQMRPLTDLGGSTTPSGTSREELAFLKAFAFERLKKVPEAIETYLSIRDGRAEYYGWRSTERLRALATDDAAKGAVAMEIGRAASALIGSEPSSKERAARTILRMADNQDLRDRALAALKTTLPPLPRQIEPPGVTKIADIPKDPAKDNLAARLSSLSLYDEAAAELDNDASEPSPRTLDVFNRGDRADLVMEYVEPIWKPVAADYPLSLVPKQQLELLYPAPFASKLASNAAANGVDPRLMLAIMRQESRFRPDAKSNAAARGLMQFISTTSNKVAGEIGRDNFRQDELYSPSTAILFGSRYLADLFSAFPGQPEAVVASYNGGDDNMKRWFNRSRSNQPERYVPEIAYAQSKDYVHRVISSYFVYKSLYDEQLRPLSAQ